VVGLSGECQNISGPGGAPAVFLRVGYCSLDCNMHPSTPECMACMSGGSGMF
jgi:organic radical activating enzyme